MMNFYKNFYVALVTAFALFSMSKACFASTNIGVPVSVDSRIKTFVYSQNEVFPVVFNYGYHSYIEFSQGETVRVMALGDNANWKIRPVDNKLYVMPLEKEGHTNMLIETSKGRSYAFDLISTAIPLSGGAASSINKLGKTNSALADLAYVVRFYYPQSDRNFDTVGQKLEISPPSLASSLDADDVEIEPNATRTNYMFTGGSAHVSLAPTQAFDDGYLTYFQFGKNNKEIPKIYVVKKDGKKVPCKMLLLRDYVIVEGVHELFYLDFGDGRSVEVVNQALS
ncbi:P-type conjugative transfer protein VirB9 [Anaplasma phagocytophilum]|uniref:Type IV secretion system protein n=4 Tax=Anaplasma phagocytophilum TaxID=948 RepID=K9P1M8_ANAPH|nr:P-type conjugative transfer protein VirB9 [Anaplasma phagocytophilum]AFY26786.1 type IV secretion system protein [Anaplasma phagocytophilum]